MQQELLMGIDLGTSFIKAGVYDLTGTCLVVTKTPVEDERPAPGIFIQRGERLYQAVLDCMKKASDALGDRAGQVAVLSFTGQMAGFMGVDLKWNDVTGWSCSLDTRYTPYANRQIAELKDAFVGISGTTSPLFSAKYEWFSKEFPEESKRIAKYLMISSYVIGKLGDLPIEEAVIDASLITWTGLADVKKRVWSEKICSRLGISEAYLPRITASSEVVAHLSEQAAKLTGLPAGIPLVSGAGDKIAGCVGADVLKKGNMLYEAASFGGFSCGVGDCRPDFKHTNYDILNGWDAESLYAHYYMPGSGITMDWFLNNTRTDFEEMDREMAKIPPGSEGLFAVGMLGGTVMPLNSSLKGAWIGHTWSHTTAHFYRALSESFAYSLKIAMDCILENYPECDPETIRIIGGGAGAENGTQLLADVIGKSFETIGREDCALWGACLLGAKGIGLVEDLESYAASHIEKKRIFVPDWQKHEIYKDYVTQYREQIESVTSICKKLRF